MYTKAYTSASGEKTKKSFLLILLRRMLNFNCLEMKKALELDEEAANLQTQTQPDRQTHVKT